MGFQHVTPYNILDTLAAGTVDNVQSGTVTMTGTSQTDSITAVVLNKAFLVFGWESDEGGPDPDINQVQGIITSTTQLTFARENSTNTVIIRWFVIEFKSTALATVQRGEHTSSFSNVNISISTVDLNHSFPIINWENSGTSLADDDIVKAELTNFNILNLKIDSGATCSANVAWQVIENFDWFVTKYNFSLDSSTNNSLETITAVDLSKVMLFITGYIDNGTSANGEEMFSYTFQSATQLDIYRSNPTATWPALTAYTIEGSDINSQHHDELFTTNDENQTITAVDLSKSMATVNGCLGGTFVNNETNTNAGGQHVFAWIRFVDSTTVEFQRDSGSFDAWIGLQVIEFS